MKKRCDICGVELIRNENGDLICPNHGIVEENKELNGEGKRNYIG